jgi:hypothetical protein
MWEPLLAIADVADGEWPKRARNAGLVLVRAHESEAGEADIQLMLLSDIRDIFANEFPPGHAMHKQPVEDAEPNGLHGPRLPTGVVLDRLHRLEERPWSCWGKTKLPMTGNALGALLRAFGVSSRTVRVGSSTSKGYYLRLFEDAFARYLTLAPPAKRHTVTARKNPGENESFASVTSETCDGLETAGNASKSAGCDGVTLQEGGMTDCEENVTTADDSGGGLTETLL